MLTIPNPSSVTKSYYKNFRANARVIKIQSKCSRDHALFKIFPSARRRFARDAARPRRHGAGSPVLGRCQQQPVTGVRSGIMDSQPDLRIPVDPEGQRRLGRQDLRLEDAGRACAQAGMCSARLLRSLAFRAQSGHGNQVALLAAQRNSLLDRPLSHDPLRFDAAAPALSSASFASSWTSPPDLLPLAGASIWTGVTVETDSTRNTRSGPA